MVTKKKKKCEMEGGELAGGKGHGAISQRPKWRSPALPPTSPQVLGKVQRLRRPEEWGPSPFLLQTPESQREQRASLKHTLF